MARPRTRLPWRYDEQKQEFITPAGVVTLHELAALRYGLASSHVDLSGPWAGWRLRGALLKSPRGLGITVRPEIAAQFGRWMREVEANESVALGLEAHVKRVQLKIVK